MKLMLNFRNTSIALSLTVVIGLLSVLFKEGLLVFCFLFLAVFWLMILILGSIFIRWNFYFFSHSHGARNSPAIAITFDDGPDEKITPKILEILEKYKIKAAFFCIGQKIERHPELLKKIVEKGHIVGNHTYSHSFWFDLFSSLRMADEISKTDELIMKFTGNKPNLFRPPYGVTNPLLRKALKKTGHQSVSWSLRSNDTFNSPEAVLLRIHKKLKNGDTILFHDTMPDSPAIVEQFILETQKAGKQFVGLDEILKLEAYDKPHQ
jgi:peptidoglycan-N-acetylglucosamine deacetylase